jgi:hypothetical protein
MGRMIKLHWENNFANLVLQTTTHAGEYAVLDLAQLGHRIGYAAHFSPPHRKRELPEWLPLGVFPDVVSAQQRCSAHFLGTAYIPLERSVMPQQEKLQ